ncbi:hypothetical protein ACFLQ5_02475 [Bacteroidota bacterium]
MKRTLLTYCFFIFTFYANSQHCDVFHENMKSQTIFSSIDLSLNSSAITNQFIDSYINGKFITQKLKNRNYDRMSKNNVFGFNNDFKAAYFFKPVNSLFSISNLGLFFTIENHDLIEIKFRKELFNLMFNGNSQFAGKSVDLNDMLYRQLNYQQFKFGLFKSVNWFPGESIIGASIAINKGQKELTARIDEASLYTHQYGESLNLNLKMDVNRTDTNHTKLLAFNGIGTSIDFFYLYDNLNGDKLLFEMENFGFIRWNKNSNSFAKDSAYSFEGWPIDNILNVRDDEFDNFKSDTLVSEFAFDKVSKPYSSFLPMQIKFSYTKKIITEKLSITASVKEIFFSAFKPYYTLKPNYNFHPKLGISALVTYGGYGGFNSGIEVNIQDIKGFTLCVGSNFINSYLYPENYSGQGGYLRLYKTF